MQETSVVRFNQLGYNYGLLGQVQDQTKSFHFLMLAYFPAFVIGFMFPAFVASCMFSRAFRQLLFLRLPVLTWFIFKLPIGLLHHLPPKLNRHFIKTCTEHVLNSICLDNCSKKCGDLLQKRDKVISFSDSQHLT